VIDLLIGCADRSPQTNCDTQRQTLRIWPSFLPLFSQSLRSVVEWNGLQKRVRNFGPGRLALMRLKKHGYALRMSERCVANLDSLLEQLLNGEKNEQWTLTYLLVMFCQISRF
jgi:hypothetical protein